MPTSRLSRFAESRSCPNGFSMTTRRQPPSWSLVVEPDASELGDDLGELRRLGGEVEEAVAACPVLLVHLVEHRLEAVEAHRLREVEVLIRDPLGERAPGGLIERQDPAVLLERRLDPVPERLVVERPAADGQHPELVRQQVRPPQVIERRQDLAMGQVAGRAEQDQHARVGDARQAEPFAQHVLHGLGAGAALPGTGQPQLLHRPRRVLRAGRRLGGDRLVRGRHERRRILDLRGPRPLRLPGHGHRVVTRS